MEIFIILLLKLLPLYFLILLGYIGGRFLSIKKESIASLLIYIVAPVIVFTGVVTTKLTLSTLSIPLLFFFIACFLSLLFYFFSGLIWKDSTKNILSFIAGSANVGYFGLPVVVAIFGEGTIGIVVLSVMGMSLYSNSLGFFLTAKGHHTTEESLIKVLKLPLFYAFIFGVVINLYAVKLGNIYFDMANSFNGTFTILGMMLIGLGLSDIKEYKFDLKFIAISLIAKFLFWPLMMLTIIFVDSFTFKLYNTNLHKVFMLLAIVPIAANTVSYATVLKTQPEKSALTVLISTLFALFYIPIIALYFLI